MLVPCIQLRRLLVSLEVDIYANGAIVMWRSKYGLCELIITSSKVVSMCLVRNVHNRAYVYYLK